MADYIYRNGNISMMIRDLGIGNNWVEYWVLTDQSTFNHEQDWSATGYSRRTFDMNSRGTWQRVGSTYIGGSQNVSFTMYDEGLGFPTYTYTVWINRAAVPAPPTMNSAKAISTSQVDVAFSYNGDGGSPIREWQIGYGTDPYNPRLFVGSDGTSRIGGLASGQKYYFWARGRNDIGWGPWSARAQTITWRVPDAPSAVTFDLITQTSARSTVKGKFDGGESVDEWEVAYSLVNDLATATRVTTNGTMTHTGLSPGRQYYFWARGRNAVGWGPYSSVRVLTLLAGALVKDGLVYKRAVPYVNDKGVWKLARGMAKASGTWKVIS